MSKCYSTEAVQLTFCCSVAMCYFFIVNNVKFLGNVTSMKKRTI
jgi:hypothetical protein